MPTLNLNALSPTGDINTHVELVNKTAAQYGGEKGIINPTTFYTKQLLDTIRIDSDQFVYHRYADVAPIGDKADEIQIRRWAPLQAHTVPLIEGVPPVSDKGSVERYVMKAYQYGRYMEFTDKVDFAVVDPIIAHYTREYSIVAMETMDLLARQTLLSIANKFFAGMAANFEALDLTSIPALADLRKAVLSLKKQLVKPRSNGRFHVIGSAEFYYDMVSDPLVEQYMRINQTTKTMYDDNRLVPLFEMEFYETQCVPTSGEFISSTGKECLRLVATKADGTYAYRTIDEDTTDGAAIPTTIRTIASQYVKDTRTGQDASYIPDYEYWDLDRYNSATTNTAVGGETLIWQEFKVQHTLMLGKDCLTRTGLTGQDQAKVYVKEKGSAGVLDPIDQRQSIGFKINSVGYGSTRLEAVMDYLCVPTMVNAL